MIDLVLSGGQTGADQAAWRAAKRCSVPTGGWMPVGFMTERPNGRGYEPHPEFADLYGARELEEEWWCTSLADQYRERTKRNVQCADATIIFGELGSPGSKLAYRIWRQKVGETGKDHGIGYVRNGWISVPTRRPWPNEEAAAKILMAIPHRVVNFCGNRESSSPGIGDWVEAYMFNLLQILKERS